MMKLAIFDLDYTIWQPEMYQLRGPPVLRSIDDIQKQKKQSYSQRVLQEALTTSPNKVLVDRNGWMMQMFDGA
jgi:Acid Phosphatase